MGLFKTHEDDIELKVGNRIRIKETGEEGMITGKEGEDYLVLLNNSVMIEKFHQEEVEKIW